ncbi:hypothetical protein [Evansella tamaricis]|uniref:Class I SAM-dependent methyltransferase n=1 Tax=Evansella tamaricis TaxID=2069301 RepID=A0ABS6JN90_9BACI|nr:hypothetical protein [Evansella tamaricis]MBU9713783.1 hypothetical protein [Evansella tamaricis]
MDFYTVLSRYYDLVFQKNKKALSMIKHLVEIDDHTSLLDLGAGTGEEAIDLAFEGYHVIAADLNED